MENTEVLNAAEPSADDAQKFDLGQWLGRHQALACVVTHSSAADAHALRTIRDQKLYRCLGITWDEFCPRHAGISRATANRIIEDLNEFGAAYFRLSEILKIPAPQYRAIQGAIEDGTLEFDGRRIPINRENTESLIEAVRELRGRVEKLQKTTHQSPLLTLQRKMDDVLSQIGELLRHPDLADENLVNVTAEDHAQRVLNKVYEHKRNARRAELAESGEEAA
jgi:hypothetical protein